MKWFPHCSLSQEHLGGQKCGCGAGWILQSLLWMPFSLLALTLCLHWPSCRTDARTISPSIWRSYSVPFLITIKKVLQPKLTCPLLQQTHELPPSRRKDRCLPVYALLTRRIGEAEGKERRQQEAKAGTCSSPSPWHLNEPHDRLC